MNEALKAAGAQPSAFAAGQPIATDNYGRVADGLRVVQVVCVATT